MTIRNAHSYLEGVWDWGILKGCFGETKIEPTDIDGFVERNGRFLVLETKHKDVPIMQGQFITFNKLVSTGYFTIIILWGNQNQPEQMQVLYPFHQTKIKEANIEDFRRTVKWWYNYANNFKHKKARVGAEI